MTKSIFVKCLVLMLFFPCFLMANINDEYSELFCQYLSQGNFYECEEVLDDWERYYNPGSGQIAALKALSLLCAGETVSGRNLLEEALNSIPERSLTDSMKSIIRNTVDHPSSLTLEARDISYDHIRSCRSQKAKADGSKSECMNECLGPNPSGGLQLILCLILCSLGGN